MKMAPHLVLFDGLVDYTDFFHVVLGEGEKIRMNLRGLVGGAVVLIGKRDDLNEVIKLYGSIRGGVRAAQRLGADLAIQDGGQLFGDCPQLCGNGDDHFRRTVFRFEPEQGDMTHFHGVTSAFRRRRAEPCR